MGIVGNQELAFLCTAIDPDKELPVGNIEVEPVAEWLPAELDYRLD